MNIRQFTLITLLAASTGFAAQKPEVTTGDQIKETCHYFPIHPGGGCNSPAKITFTYWYNEKPYKVTINYMSDEKNGSGLKPCSVSILVDWEPVEIVCWKQCSAELLAILQKDYKNLVAKVQNAEMQEKHIYLDLFNKNAAHLAKQNTYSDDYEKYENAVNNESPRFNDPLLKEFSETFSADSTTHNDFLSFLDESNIDYPKEWTFPWCTAEHQIDIIKVDMEYEKASHRCQQALEIYFAMFLGKNGITLA